VHISFFEFYGKWPEDARIRPKHAATIYRVSIKVFPDYKYLLQGNYAEYKHTSLPLQKLVSKKLLELSYILKKKKEKFVFHVAFL